MKSNRSRRPPPPRSVPTSERLLAILAATIDLVNLTDTRYEQLFYLNHAGRTMLGIPPDADVSKLRITDFHPRWALDRVHEEGIPAALKEGVWVGETAFTVPTGEELIVSQLILAHRAPDGKVEYLSTIARDITGSRRAQDALRRSEEMFRIITENASELIALVDTKGRRLYNSPSYQRVLGYTPEELHGTWSLEQIHPDDRELIIAAAEEARTTGIGRFIEYRMRHKDGSWRTLESHAGTIRNALGEIESILVVARDITERKRVEQERERTQLQLHHAQKLESSGRLAAGIAHEINTPIQYIGDNTRFLQDSFAELNTLLTGYEELADSAANGSIDPMLMDRVSKMARHIDVKYLVSEIPKAIVQSLEGIERVSQIVCAMKQFSHPGTEEKVAIDINQAIESTLTVARNEWKYIADLVTDFDRSLPLIPCLPGEFNQVILNLVVNAAHAVSDVVGDGSRGKGIIRVTTRNDGNWVEVRIQDTGSGIPQSIRSRIFEPFFTTKPFGKGTGQGLAITHSVIVERHRGELTFESEEGNGTTFIIRLPIGARTVSSSKDQ